MLCKGSARGAGAWRNRTPVPQAPHRARQLTGGKGFIRTDRVPEESGTERGYFADWVSLGACPHICLSGLLLIPSIQAVEPQAEIPPASL